MSRLYMDVSSWIWTRAAVVSSVTEAEFCVQGTSRPAGANSQSTVRHNTQTCSHNSPNTDRVHILFITVLVILTVHLQR